jgi:hypothetical protein
MKFRTLFFIALILGTSAAWASQNPAGLAAYEGHPHLKAIRLDPAERITLDGRLDEAAWQRAEVASDFTQQDPPSAQRFDSS